MGAQTWVELANAYTTSGITAGTALANSTTKTDISPGGKELGQAFTLGATVPLVIPGKIIRWTAAGVFSTTATPSITLGLYWGGSEAGTLLAESKIKCETVSNQVWTLQATSRVSAGGVGSGKVFTLGSIYGFVGKATETTSAGVSMLPYTGPNEVTVDTSAQKQLTLAATWSAASASNSVQVTQWLVEILN